MSHEEKCWTLDKPVASLCTCHLGICLGWQSCSILLNLICMMYSMFSTCRVEAHAPPMSIHRFQSESEKNHHCYDIDILQMFSLLDKRVDFIFIAAKRSDTLTLTFFVTTAIPGKWLRARRRHVLGKHIDVDWPNESLH